MAHSRISNQARPSQMQPRGFRYWKSPRLKQQSLPWVSLFLCLTVLTWKKIFLISCLTFLFQLKPFASHPSAMRCSEKPGSIFSITYLYALQNAARLPQNCCFSRPNKLQSLSFSTLTGQLLPTLMSGQSSAELIPVYQYLSCTVCPKLDTVFWTLNTALPVRLDLTAEVGFTGSEPS